MPRIALKNHMAILQYGVNFTNKTSIIRVSVFCIIMYCWFFIAKDRSIQAHVAKHDIAEVKHRHFASNVPAKSCLLLLCSSSRVFV